MSAFFARVDTLLCAQDAGSCSARRQAHSMSMLLTRQRQFPVHDAISLCMTPAERQEARFWLPQQRTGRCTRRWLPATPRSSTPQSLVRLPRGVLDSMHVSPSCQPPSSSCLLRANPDLPILPCRHRTGAAAAAEAASVTDCCAAPRAARSGRRAAAAGGNCAGGLCACWQLGATRQPRACMIGICS